MKIREMVFLFFQGENTCMSMVRKTIFSIILGCLVAVTTLCLNGYGDDWVKISRDAKCTIYYSSSSVKIDEQKQTLEVLIKRVYTEKGINEIFDQSSSSLKNKYSDINYHETLDILDYKEMKYCLLRQTYYSKSGNVLSNNKIASPKWYSIKPGGTGEFVYNKILKDYNIQANSISSSSRPPEAPTSPSDLPLPPPPPPE
jgi:hypothetical protein